MANLFRTQNSK